MARGRWDKGGRGHDPRHVAGAAAAVVFAAAVLGFFFYQSYAGKPPPVDKVTFCPEKIDSVTAVLLDATDELGVVQRAAIKSRLDEVKDGLPRRARIDVYAVDNADGRLPRAIFSMCNPGSGEDADALKENARLMKRRWTKDFGAKLSEELDRVLGSKAAKYSPIMESIQAVAVQSFGASATRDAHEKRLVVVSDMIQSVPQYNQYKAGPSSFEAFARSEYFRKVRADLRGAEVEIHYLRRETSRAVQGKEHLMFWERYVRESAGRLVRFLPVEG